VVLIYSSPRKLCAFAIGIARSVAKQFNETIEVTQTKCMHNGAPIVKLSSARDGDSGNQPRRNYRFGSTPNRVVVWGQGLECRILFSRAGNDSL
jgi:hypothetical protein